MFPFEYSQEELERLTFAFIRRKKFEARIIANEIGSLFGGKKESQDRISPDQMWELVESL